MQCYNWPTYNPQKEIFHNVRDPQIGMCHASLDRIVELYNKLPANIKAMKIRPFKRYLKKDTVKTS